jgi:hypothetical protein
MIRNKGKITKWLIYKDNYIKIYNYEEKVTNFTGQILLLLSHILLSINDIIWMLIHHRLIPKSSNTITKDIQYE